MRCVDWMQGCLEGKAYSRHEMRTRISTVMFYIQIPMKLRDELN